MAHARSLPWSLRTALALSVALIAAVMLAGVTPARAVQPLYYPFGPQTGVDESELDGWQLCYQTNYNIDSTDPANDLDTVLAACDGEFLLLGGKPVGSTVFDVVAAAPRADVITDTGTGNTPHDANGSGWYFNDDHSWGFARQGDAIFRDSCDTVDDPGVTGQYRLCWHTETGAIEQGYRSGLNSNLQAGNTTHERFIYESLDGAPAYYPEGPQTGVDESELVGWTLCYQTNYGVSSLDPVNDLDTVLADCDGSYLLLAGRPVESTVFDVLAAAPREDVIFDAGFPSNTPHDANGSGWYFNAATLVEFASWGFAPEGAAIERGSCDREDSSVDQTGSPDPLVGAMRLCWHTRNGAIDEGWRSGNATNLQAGGGVDTHERFIYESADGIPTGPPPPPPGTIDNATSFQFASVFFIFAMLEVGPASNGILPTSEPFILRLGGQDVVFEPGDLTGSSIFATGATLSDGVVAQVWLIQLFPGQYLLIAFGYGAEPFDDGDVEVEIGDDQFIPEGDPI